MGTKHNLSLVERFLLYVSIPENLNDCWMWIGGRIKSGYGHFSIKDKSYKAHRISFELFVGPIPENLLVCHSCDNRACVNPKHLFLGTPKDNIQDMIKKNRKADTKGEKHGRHKLNKQDVHEIRKLSKQGYVLKELANRFNVSIQQISRILLYKSWRWLK